MTSDPSTLARILSAREERHKHIQDLLTRFGASILVLTLNIPGSKKNPPWTEELFRTGRDELAMRFTCYTTEYVQYRYTAAGRELIAVIRTDARQLKRECIAIEQEHPLGRLFDIDVHGREGALSRGELGADPRRCLLCTNDARVCSRMGLHTLEEVLQREREMVREYHETGSLSELYPGEE